ncbi:hypothetical protein DSM03_104133 [Leeuwenhoekiella aestuarii]|uniref:tetratricopeptide repeat-containing sensor histidine kinase n=1 Tax=Leeuwenhoekiella aestuarii TaxID=2249426 RepID=UPI000FFEA300|nr:hypothetical protein [Leeuwenhoekiella aestuarii]RXG14975.1 hypothetical protein DSM03_104133 [Leeuwenhoekiella aestuarii]
MKNTHLSFLFLVFSFIQFPAIGQQAINKDTTVANYYKVLLNPSNPSTYNEAIRYYTNAYQKNLKQKKYTQAIYNLELLAIGKFNIGAYNDSETLLVAALKLTKKDTARSTTATRKRIYYQLSLLYKNLKAYDKSLALQRSSLAHAETGTDSAQIMITISNVLREQQAYAPASDTLKYAFKMLKNIESNYLKAYILDNLGYTELLAKNDFSLVHLHESLALRKKLNDPHGLFSNYRHLSLYHKQADNLDSANTYAMQALELSYQIEDPEYEHEALGILVNLKSDTLAQRFKFLSDSINTVKQANRNTYAAMEYDVEQEQQKTQQAMLENERQKRINTLYLSGIVLLLVMGTGGLVWMQQRKKTRLLKTIRQTEASISKKVHDGLANDTFQVLSELQNLNSVPEHILERLDKIYIETRNISKDHSPLIEGANFKDQLTSRLNSYKTEELSIITRNLDQIDWTVFSQLKKDTIYMVLGELLTNAKKHSEASLILLSFETKNKHLHINYSDNGIGGPVIKGNGMQNMEFRIRAIKGTINFESESNKGFKVQIVL